MIRRADSRAAVVPVWYGVLMLVVLLSWPDYAGAQLATAYTWCGGCAAGVISCNTISCQEGQCCKGYPLMPGACPVGCFCPGTPVCGGYECASGTYQGQTRSTVCLGTACPPGQYGPGRQTSQALATCSACASGTYQGQTGSTVCLACASGTYQGQTGSTVCLGTACPPGQYGPGGQTSQALATCSACASGTYQGQTGSTVCLKCPPGKYSYAGQMACMGTICPAGKYGPEGQASPQNATCLDCASGSYSATAGQQFCYGFAATGVGWSCPSGTWGPGGQTSSDKAICSGTPCPAGTFGPVGQTSPVLTSCSACVAGTFSGALGVSTCESTSYGVCSYPCAPGQYGTAGLTGITSQYECGFLCKFCDAGKYTNLTGQSVCQTCHQGTYEFGRTGCLPVKSSKSYASGTTGRDHHHIFTHVVFALTTVCLSLIMIVS
jgi:hypothetical protein